MSPMEHAFWTVQRVANSGFTSSINIQLRFETLLNESAQVCFRISLWFADEPLLPLFSVTLSLVNCEQFCSDPSRFPPSLFELVNDETTRVDLVEMGEDKILLSFRQTNTAKELPWFSTILSKAVITEQNSHLRHIVAQLKTESSNLKAELKKEQFANEMLRSQLKSLEETVGFIRGTVGKVIGSISPHSEATSSQVLAESMAAEVLDKSSGPSTSAASSTTKPELPSSNRISDTNNELLLGIASYLLCAVCEKVSVPAKDSNELSRHFIDEHVDDAKRSCLACPGANVFDLGAHMKTHTYRVYACEFCGKKGRKHYLKSHVRTHTGEKPFKCQTCGRQFADQSTIRRHQTTVHSVEKKFVCPICGRDISRKDNYRVHLKNHAAVFPTENPTTEEKSPKEENNIEVD